MVAWIVSDCLFCRDGFHLFPHRERQHWSTVACSTRNSFVISQKEWQAFGKWQAAIFMLRKPQTTRTDGYSFVFWRNSNVVNLYNRFILEAWVDLMVWWETIYDWSSCLHKLLKIWLPPEGLHTEPHRRPVIYWFVCYKFYGFFWNRHCVSILPTVAVCYVAQTLKVSFKYKCILMNNTFRKWILFKSIN